MARIEKTVFISYRRTDVYTALAVYENLKNQGYDVFFDYRSISSGDFEQIITSNIKARAHFVLILTTTALDRCNEPGDWLRREIETAMDERRNIVPLFFKGFRFGDPSVSEKLTGKLENLSRYNGLNVHEDFFDEAIDRLREQYLDKPLNTVLHPVSTEVQKVVIEEQFAADKALEQIDDVKELVKKVGREPDSRNQSVPVAHSSSSPLKSWGSIGFAAGGLLFIAFLIWGALANRPVATPEPTASSQANITFTPQPSSTVAVQSTKNDTPSSIQPSVAPEVTLGTDPAQTGEDGMTLLYVPASQFTMGSNTGTVEERPAHNVDLDAFWIDQTEVTVEMYLRCVEAEVCTDRNPYIQSDYFTNATYSSYPVMDVSWEDAKAYCEWVGRRLPTEAEWERAARGEQGFFYPWGNDFSDGHVNFCDKNCSFPAANLSFDDGFAQTAPVGSFPGGASPYGALDMAGNVAEWVADWYSETYYSVSPSTNPPGPDSGEKRVFRGGSWSTRSDFGLRASYRSSSPPGIINLDVGFRCATSVAP